MQNVQWDVDHLKLDIFNRSIMDTRPKAIICDLDGTLALIEHRSPYDASTAEQDILNNPVANILHVYSQQKEFPIDILLLSGRDEQYRPQTVAWSKRHGITYSELYLRPTNDKRRDTVFKKEVYEAYIQDKYDVLFVLEDRTQVVNMWRREGLTCLQVAPGDF